MNEQIKKEPVVLETNDIVVLVKEFRGKKFNDKLVFDFCTRHKINPIDAGSIEDYIYQQEYDERMAVVLPLVLAEIAKYQYVGEFASETKKKEILQSNDDISAEISQIVSDNGVEYRELDVLKTLDADITLVLNSAYNRLSGMGATVLHEMALEKLGNPLTIKSMENEREQIADRKYKKEQVGGAGGNGVGAPAEETPLEDTPNATEVNQEDVAEKPAE